MPRQKDQRANTVSELPARLSAPARRALASAGYTRLEQLSTTTEAQLLQLHGMGPKAIAELRHALAERGLSFGTKAGA